jgi:biotin transport system permease protein
MNWHGGGSSHGVPAVGTWLHRWPAGLKLLLLLAMATGFVLVRQPIWLGASALALFVVWRSVVGPIQWRAWRQAWWLAITIAAVVIYVMFFSGVTESLVVLFRLLALLFAALAVVASTPISAMMAVIERVLAPLGRRGWVNPEKVALAFGLSLRMVPVLLEQWQEIREAQAARGVSAVPFALLVPMLARTIKRADELAEAIDARADISDMR